MLFTPAKRSFFATIVFVCLIAVVKSKANVALSTKKGSNQIRIVNGTIVPIEDVPWTVQITNNYGLFYCGGSLISDRFVVSAAHCFDDMSKESLRIVAGTNEVSLGVGRVISEIENFWLHPDYELSYHMDVAVVKLTKPVKLSSKIQPIPMCTKPLEAFQSIQVLGWGRTFFKSDRTSQKLRSVIVPVLPQEQCMWLLKDVSLRKMTDSMICAGIAGYKDACDGDSGGPAVRRGKLCAMVSWGEGCADNYHPGTYTSIPVVRNFIDKCMKL